MVGMAAGFVVRLPSHCAQLFIAYCEGDQLDRFAERL